MPISLTRLGPVAVLLAALAAPVASLAEAHEPADPFAAENATVDTSIPFAIGAREARAELRGAFGWSTFQEGFVNGVYFRFDPDGYARFSPTPRFDQDVFEVICRPGTLTCMGRKQGLTLMLNDRGMFQISIEGVQPGDRFFLAEGITELELPDRILQPLDPRMEALLGGGGQLVVRRADKEIARIELAGIDAVMAYLRWIAAGQDYIVLPRDWPVPNSTAPITSVPDVTAGFDRALPPPPGPGTAAAADAELETLRQLVLTLAGAPAATGPSAMPVAANESPVIVDDPMPGLEARIAALEARVAALEAGMSPAVAAPPLAGIPGATMAPRPTSTTAPDMPAMPWQESATPPPLRTGLEVLATGGQGAPESPAVPAAATELSIADRMEFLMEEFGLDARTALTLVELADPSLVSDPAPALSADADLQALLVDAGVIADRASPALGFNDQEGGPTRQNTTAVQQDDYVLLSEYFRSVLETE